MTINFSNIAFQCSGITYPVPAAGWINGVYHPRKPRRTDGEAFLKAQDGLLRIQSRVWKETENTGYGIFYYEETALFSAVLPKSNYKVELCFANQTSQPYDCHIRVNGMIKKDALTIPQKKEVRVAVLACITDGSFSLSIAAGKLSETDAAPVVGEVYIKKISIVPEPEKEKRGKPTLFLVSDSTVQSYDAYFAPQAGWGQMLYAFFQGAGECRERRIEECSYSIAKAYVLPKLVIENRSIGGRSAKSFYEEGKLDEILEVAHPGDYMFIQFAHNDATPSRPNRYVPPEEFSNYLNHYIRACQRRGMQPVLVTPVAMRNCKDGERFHISFRAYREQMIAIARRERIPLLDLGARSTAYLNRIGRKNSEKLYLWLKKGEYPDGAYKDGASDNGHLSEYGAKIYAGMVAQLIWEYNADHSLDALKRREESLNAMPNEKLVL